MRWLLTEAREGTFVDAEFGIDSEKPSEVIPTSTLLPQGTSYDAGSSLHWTDLLTPLQLSS
jgi:hypothetical protein